MNRATRDKFVSGTDQRNLTSGNGAKISGARRC